ncbi:MAG: CDP-glucose 4,6-dehydratase [Lamprobacter sp.]|uniref:CDP-glucose 4,6-dehydratase n=1 Tax=Lamprobacter sp. TaxID=3100796 RepID=UPI002B258583|nr:CDP-glucose 4,6-dehydratase [Lamprobacter sp.]MEA3641480.1 CDP-glucose 4,6-dehydratase [Lamprobacter sp.]
MPTSNPDPAFWPDKRILLTGHTGFKGSWLAYWLDRLGAQVTGIALPPATAPNLFDLLQLGTRTASQLLDLREAPALAQAVQQAAPEIVFHLAAQPLVRASYRDPLGTIATNVLGTAHLLDALRACPSARVVVVITTDKVYRNTEQPYPYRETDPLGGHDPYSASKAAAEIILASYRDAFLHAQGIAVASARAGNVIGGGDWSQDRLIPDAVRAWSQQQPLHIRRPGDIRPWQHVLEPLAAYLKLAEQLWHTTSLADAYNFGPLPQEAATVRQVIERARAAYGRGEVHWGDGTEGPHEAGCLTLEIAQARARLGIAPRWTLAQSIDRTLSWYHRLSTGAEAAQLCDEDIAAFLADAP